MRALIVIFVLAAPLLAERVTFQASDGKQIVGTWNQAAKDAPTVICLPMYRNVRASYKPLVAPLILKGINVLAIDLRGHGDSAPESRVAIEKRDPKPFQAMHLDVAAAIDFLEKEKGCDRTRIGLIGASVGCSVAIDYTRRNPGDVRAAVLLTPGSKYLGVDSLAHLENWPGTRVFTFVSTEEKATSAGVMDALDPFDGSNRMVVPGKGIHGTRMFGKVNQIEELLANFFESSLLGKVDLRARQGTQLERRNADMAAMVEFRPDGCRATVWAKWKGSAIFKIGKQTVRVPFLGRSAADHKPLKVGDAQAEYFDEKGRTGVRFPFKMEPGTTVSVEFKARKGKGLRFPSKGVYSIQPMKTKDG